MMTYTAETLTYRNSDKTVTFTQGTEAHTGQFRSARFDRVHDRWTIDILDIDKSPAVVIVTSETTVEYRD